MTLRTTEFSGPSSSPWRALFLGGLSSLFLLFAAAGCVAPGDDDDDDSAIDDDDDDDDGGPFAFSSPEFEDGGDFPQEFECFNPNPEIVWENVPDGTETLTLIFDDPTAGNFPHWAIYNIPADEDGLAEAISGGGDASDLPDGAGELLNGANQIGYLGSCPCGPTPNTYRWRLWAVDTTLDPSTTGSSQNQYAGLASDAEDASVEMLEMGHRYGPATICR